MPLKKRLFRIYMAFIVLLGMPIVFADYFKGSTGRDYGVGIFRKLYLMIKMFRNTKKVSSASSFAEHLIMATRILQTPKKVEGVATEFGCFKGGSSVNISLVCRLAGRKLVIFDSFEGLPEPTELDKKHIVMDDKETHTYKKGAYCGPLELVKENISKFGAIEVCSFVKGYFDKTLPSFREKVMFSFMDVDLLGSLEPCVKYIWPLLQDGCYVFVHESHHTEIAALFFDRQWWKENLDSEIPGIVGGGSGLGLIPYHGGFKSSIGYTIKNPQVLGFTEEEQV